MPMYEIGIRFPIIAPNPELAEKNAHDYLYPFLDDAILDSPEVIREIPPLEAELYTPVND